MEVICWETNTMAKAQKESGKGLSTTVPPQRLPGGWTGQRFHPGRNGTFEAELSAIYSTMRMAGITYMIFSNSTVAIKREQ